MYKSSESVHIHQSLPVMSTTYPESAYQWLVEVLNGLINFWEQHEHFGIINLTEEEYQWLDDVLEELIYSVGENENHFLAPLMEFIIRIISNYEDTYVSKLTEQNTRLAEKGTTKIVSEDELAAHGFFSIGYLLWQGNRKGKSLFAYDKAIALKPNFAEAHANRGVTKLHLGQTNEAKSEFKIAMELAEQQGQEELKTFIEEQLQELDKLTPQNREN
ncbi:MAG: tetratricopeptide repeat protein [Candidatus Poribacteria bacterium]|nr:tetratricopeptide repeat protein [Candidatus Poribacteria bacterium]